METKIVDGVTYKLVICKYIKRKGIVIYPKRSSVFRFWVPIDKAA